MVRRQDFHTDLVGLQIMLGTPSVISFRTVKNPQIHVESRYVWVVIQ